MDKDLTTMFSYINVNRRQVQWYEYESQINQNFY